MSLTPKQIQSLLDAVLTSHPHWNMLLKAMTDEWTVEETSIHYNQYITQLYNETIYQSHTLNEYQLDIVTDPLYELIDHASFLAQSGKVFHSLAICTTILGRVEEIDQNSLSECQVPEIIDQVETCMTEINTNSTARQRKQLYRKYTHFLQQISKDNMYKPDFEEFVNYFVL